MKIEESIIITNENVIQNIYKMKVKFKGESIKPGQFFMLKTLNGEFLLPRPISVNDADEDSVTFLYRVEGIGTAVISNMKKEDKLQVFGPLGNGFDLNEMGKSIALVGGGIGTAPLLYLAKTIGKSADVYLGFKDAVYGIEEFEKYAKSVTIVTEDGSTGHRGFVTDRIDYSKYDTVAVCGPEIMMNKIIASCRDKDIKCFVSLERRMACGLGACLGCVAQTVKGNKRVCKEGPVFVASDLVLEGELA